MTRSPRRYATGASTGALTQVVLTHWHADHAGSAAEIGRWPGVEVLAHRLDAAVIRGDAEPDQPVFTDAERALHAQVAADLPDAPPARVDRDLEHGEVMAELGARVIATPGHTDGSIALYLAELGVLFTGDIATEHEGQVFLGPFKHRPRPCPPLVRPTRRSRTARGLLRPRPSTHR